MTDDDFRRLALELPEAAESAHQGHPDFRVRGKIFATLAYPDASVGMVKLTPDQQKTFVRSYPAAFVPVKGGWGARGATHVRLVPAEEESVRHALLTAWQNVAPKALLDALDEPD